MRRLLKDTAGATAIEYAVVAAVVSIAGVASFLLLGQSSSQQFAKVESEYARVN